MTSTPIKKRRGPKHQPLGFTNPLLAVFWPVYEQAVSDWTSETGRTPSDHFTIYAKSRAWEILRAITAPQDIASNTGFLSALAMEPDLVAFVMRRFIRMRETGDAKGKPGTLCRRGVLLMLAASRPDLAPADVAELAKESIWAHRPELKHISGEDVSAALVKPRRANHARLAELRRVNAEAEEARQAARDKLPAAASRRLEAYRKKLDALVAKHLPRDPAVFQGKAQKLAADYADVSPLA